MVIALRACKSIIPGPDFGLDKFEWFSKGFQYTRDEIDENCDEFFKDESFFSHVCEWRLNMNTGEVKQKIVTGTHFSMEFPMINQSFVGVRNKFGYTQVVDSQASSIAGNFLNYYTMTTNIQVHYYRVFEKFIFKDVKVG